MSAPGSGPSTVSRDGDAAASGTPTESAARQRRWTSASTGVWIAAAAVALVYLGRLGRDTNFFYDEWMFVDGRWRFETSTFLAAHNGHLSIIPASMYFAMFQVFGLDHYTAFRTLGLLVHISVASVVFVYARRRLGGGAGFGAGVCILLLGAGWYNILWPFQIGFMGSVAGLVGALLFLERRTLRGDIGAAVCVAIALACSGVGIPIAVGVFVETALTRPWRRWWITVAPLVVFAGWYLAYGESQADMSNWDAVPSYSANLAAAMVAGLFDLGLGWGRVGLVVLLVAAAVAVRRTGISPRIVGLGTMLLTFWVITSLSRAHDAPADASRYVYVGVVILLLLVAEIIRRQSAAVTGAGLVLALLSVWAGADAMRTGADEQRFWAEIVDAELAVAEALRDEAPSDHVLDMLAPLDVTLGQYFTAVDGIGSSPAPSLSDVAAMSEIARRDADVVAFELRPPTVRPIDRETDPCAGADIVVSQGRLSAPAGSRVVILTMDEPLTVAVGRWAPPSQIIELPTATAVEVTFLDDKIPVPWNIDASTLNVTMCVLA